MSLSLHVETKTQSPVVGVGCLPPSSHHASRGRLAARLASRLVLRSASRPVLLACLIRPAAVLVGSSSHPLVSPSAACFLLIVSSARPLPRIAWLPAPFDKRDGAGRTAGGGHRRCADGGGCLLASDGDGRRAVIDGGWLRAAGVGVAACGCLLASGRGTERLDRSSIVPLSLSSSHPIDEAPAPFIISSSHRRGGTFFPFSPDPLPPALLGLLARGLFPRPRPGDARTCVMACGGGRGGCLFAFSYPVPLSRCCSFARCYMTCVARAARSFLGRRWAFYGLF